jgi:hypothetical protein
LHRVSVSLVMLAILNTHQTLLQCFHLRCRVKSLKT